MSNKPPGYFKAPKKNEWTGETGTYHQSVQNTPSQSAMVKEVWNKIDHPSDIEQAQEMVPTGIVLAVVGFVGFILCSLFWVIFQLVK